MSSLKRNRELPPSPPPGNTDDLVSLSSLSSTSSSVEDVEDKTCLLRHGNDSDNGDDYDDNEENCNPFIDGEQKLGILRKNVKMTFVGTTLMAMVWGILGGISVGIYVEYRKTCESHSTFGMIGVCLLIYVTLRHTVFAVVLGMALYYSTNRRQFQKLANQYNVMLQKVDVGRNNSVKRHVTKGPTTKATIGMGQEIDMFNHVKRMTSMRKLNSPKTRDDGEVPQNVLLNSIMSLKNCHLMREMSRGGFAYSCSQKQDGDGSKFRNRSLLILAGMDTAPLFSVIFYVFVGISVDFSGSFKSSVCVVSLALNWILICLFTLYGIVCCIPLFFRIFQRQ